MTKKDEILVKQVAKLLREKKLTISIAESCTGGLLTHKLTSIPGASDFLKETIVCYSNSSKIRRLNIPARLLKEKGAVSSEVAALMARNVTRSEKTNVGLAITGIAGPTGGTPQKPVGLVYIGLYYKGKTKVTQNYFTGNRTTIQTNATQAALNMLKFTLEN